MAEPRSSFKRSPASLWASAPKVAALRPGEEVTLRLEIDPPPNRYGAFVEDEYHPGEWLGYDSDGEMHGWTPPVTPSARLWLPTWFTWRSVAGCSFVETPSGARWVMVPGAFRPRKLLKVYSAAVMPRHFSELFVVVLAVGVEPWCEACDGPMWAVKVRREEGGDG